MGNARVYARNLFATWFGYAANLAIMFFLTPYIIGTLGKEAYGTWSLLIKLTFFMGLVEMGVRPGLGRFITYYLGRKEPDKINAVISTAMLIFLACGGLLLIVAVTLSLCMGSLFPSLGDLTGDARIIVLLMAANLFLAFFAAAFLQVLVAHERFDITKGIEFIVLALRTAALVAVLHSGGSILAMAWVLLGAGAVQLLAQAVMAWRVFPALRISPKLASRERFSELFVFSIWAFVSSAAIQLLYHADEPMIGAMLGLETVAVFAVGAMLVGYARELVTNLGFPFAPQILKDCATRSFFEIRYLVTRATNLIMCLSMLLFLGFAFFGKEFIRLWLMRRADGDVYETFTKFDLSYDVMVVLAVSQLAATSTYVLSNVYNGLNRVRFAAVMTLIQSVLTVSLALLLLWMYRDARGAAWGAAIPRVIFAVISTAVALRWIEYGWLGFAKALLVRWAGLAAAFCAVCLAVNALLPHGTWLWFATKGALATAIYMPLAWFILLPHDERTRWGGVIRSKLFRT